MASSFRFIALLRLVALVAVASCTVTAAAPIVIAHVTIIDTLGGDAKSDQYVVISGHRIIQIGNAREVHSAKGGRVVDATGKFLIPGLWDMHVHTFFGSWVPGGRDITLPLFVANGITGVRDMGSDLEPVLQARIAIAAHRLLGPRMVVAGPMLDSPKTQFPASLAIANPAQGRQAVEMLKSRGVDFIKVQPYVPRDAYFAIADECKKQKISLAGHVPDAIRASEAVAAGQKSFEHLIGIFEGSSTVEDELLKGPKGPGRFLETYDPAREASLISLLAEKSVWQCPTLFWERGQWLVDAIDISRDPDLKYAPASWCGESWPKFKASILKSLDPDPLPVRQKFVQRELELVARLKAAGVPLLAGTDTPAGVDVIPGFSLHQELQRFVDAGLTPFAALQTATVNAAKFLGREKDFGTVDTGKIADLVLLDADPRKDIHNAEKICAVILDGHFYSREDLTQMRRQIAAKAQMN